MEQVLILCILLRPLGHLAGPFLCVVTVESGERSGLVVESLTRDGGVTSSSFTSATVVYKVSNPAPGPEFITSFSAQLN